MNTLPPAGLSKIRNGSLSDQTTRALLDAILDNKFPDGRLPAEPELAEMVGVSRTTIRVALQSLERLGMLSRVPGRGTLIRPYVGRESILLQRLIGFREMLASTHSSVEVAGRYWLAAKPGPLAVRALGVAPDTQMIMTAKSFLADGAPAIYIHDEIPLSIVPAITRERLIAGDADADTGPLFEFSQTWPGREIDHALVELVPSVMPSDSDLPLDIPPGSPYMVLLETHYTALGEPVAVTEVHVDDRFVRFQIVRHR